MTRAERETLLALQLALSEEQFQSLKFLLEERLPLAELLPASRPHLCRLLLQRFPARGQALAITAELLRLIGRHDLLRQHRLPGGEEEPPASSGATMAANGATMASPGSVANGATMATNGATMATNGATMAANGATMASPGFMASGATMVANGTTMATNGATMATSGATMASPGFMANGATMAVNGATTVPHGATMASPGPTAHGATMASYGATMASPGSIANGATLASPGAPTAPPGPTTHGATKSHQATPRPFPPSRRLTEKELMQIAQKLGKEGPEVAIICLGLERSRLEQIREDNPSSFVLQSFEMLREWRRRQRDEATASRLHACLSPASLEPELFDLLQSFQED